MGRCQGPSIRADAAQPGARLERMYAEVMEKGEEIYAVRATTGMGHFGWRGRAGCVDW